MNLLAAAVFIKFMVAIKHAVFISSLILFALAYLLLFLQDLLYTMAVILLYLLFSINAIGQLAALKAEATPGNLIGSNQLIFTGHSIPAQAQVNGINSATIFACCILLSLFLLAYFSLIPWSLCLSVLFFFNAGVAASR